MIIPYKEGVKCSVTSLWGMRTHPVTGERKMHRGVDLVIYDRLVRAVDDGEVLRINLNPNSSTAGIWVVIGHKNNIETKYFHLNHTTMRLGMKVKCGDIIGIMGNTGLGTGPHLHFEVWENGINKEPTEYLGIKNKIGPVEYLHWAEKDFIQLNQAGASFTRRVYNAYWSDQMAINNRIRKLLGGDK